MKKALTTKNLILALAVLTLSACGGHHDSIKTDYTFENLRPEKPRAALKADHFVTTWRVTAIDGHDGNTITIPTRGIGYNYSVDWGDGTTTEHTGDATHKFETAGTYAVSIKGEFPRIHFFEVDCSRLMTIEQWGSIKWQSMGYAFSGCENLAGKAKDAPDLSDVTNMSFMFAGATAFNQKIGNWKVGEVTNMSFMFEGATSFNQDIGSWTVTKVTNMSFMFAGATSFNQKVGNWKVGEVMNMAGMFYQATAFNQKIGNWKVGEVTDMSYMFSGATSFNQKVGNWKVGEVTKMRGMFKNATAFNQDIGSWTVTNVTNMIYMFKNATAFNQKIGSWDVTNVTNMSAMFHEAAAFNQDIGSWTVTNVTDMSLMFNDATAFNQDISGWTVTSVLHMNYMFRNTIFDKFLNWTVHEDLTVVGMFEGNTAYVKANTELPFFYRNITGT